MKVRFPLKDVSVQQVTSARRVENPLYAESFWQMNQHEFAMQVDGVADFYACDGSYVEYTPAEGAGNNEVELYLNGSVYGAILHQRRVLPLHGSSFRHNGITVLICGDAGAGKSSLTAAFCLDGAEFLTDDLTPMLIRDGKPFIWALSDRMKLWGDTLEQLGREEEGLQEILPGIGKYFYHLKGIDREIFSLDQVFMLEKGEGLTTEFTELTGSQKLVALRGEIYRQEYLKGMPDNEAGYFLDIVNISKVVRVFQVRRPPEAGVRETTAGMISWAMENGVWSQI